MNTRNTISAGCLVLSMLTAMAAETTFKVTKHYLNIPVSHTCERVRFNVEIPGESPMPLDIRLASDYPDYWVFADLSAYKGKKIKVSYPDNLRNPLCITSGLSGRLCKGDLIYASGKEHMYSGDNLNPFDGSRTTEIGQRTTIKLNRSRGVIAIKLYGYDA